MIVFLVGFMGCGKTTVGRKLAKILNCQFVDLDFLVEEGEKTTIEEIFKNHGENTFRNIESRYLKNLNAKGNIVVSTGGGTPCFNDNMSYMLENGVCIYIKMESKVLRDRLENSKKTRPLLIEKSGDQLLEYINATLKKREEYYLMSNIVVDGLKVNLHNLQQIINLQIDCGQNKMHSL